MDKLFVWDPSGKKGNVGHAALDISFGRGPGVAEYVSWWPYNVPGGSWRSYFVRDVTDEGYDPSWALEMHCLNADKMREQWKAILTGHKRYDKVMYNCSDVVVEVLTAGGAQLCWEVRAYINGIGLWLPYNIKKSGMDNTQQFVENYRVDQRRLDVRRRSSFLIPYAYPRTVSRNRLGVSLRAYRAANIAGTLQ